MDKGARGWLAKTAAANLWKLPWMDLDDLLQEGHVCYCLIRQKYPSAVDAPHIMRLFQVTYSNHLQDMIRHERHRKENFVVDNDSLYNTRQECPFAELALAISSLPKKASQAIALMISTDILNTPMRRHKSGHRETLNERLCRKLGLDDHQYDIPLMIRESLK